MRLGILALTLTSSIVLIACNKTEFQFGNTVPNPTPAMHDDLGNVQENTPMNVLAPISENEPIQTVPVAPIKVVRPKKIKPTTTTTADLQMPPVTNLEATPRIEQIAQPAPSNWQPNEALLIRGNELISGLQREIGKKPTIAEMQKRLQTHMGLSDVQAQQVISKLGMSS